MSIKITHNPDGSIEVECGGQKVTIQPGGGSPQPIAQPPNPFSGGSPGAMLMVPIDVGRLLERGPTIRRTAIAQPGGSVRLMMTEFAPQPIPPTNLLLRLGRGQQLDLERFSGLIDALAEEGIALKIVAEG